MWVVSHKKYLIDFFSFFRMFTLRDQTNKQVQQRSQQIYIKNSSLTKKKILRMREQVVYSRK